MTKRTPILLISMILVGFQSFAQEQVGKDTTTFYTLSYVVGQDDYLLISEIHEFDLISKSQSDEEISISNFKLQNNRAFKQLCMREYPELVNTIDDFMEINLVWLFEDIALATEKREELIYRSDKKAIFLSNFEFIDPISNARSAISIE